MINLINEELKTIILFRKIVDDNEVLKKYVIIANKSHQRIDNILVKDGLITEDQQAMVISLYSKMEYQDINVIGYSSDIVKSLSSDFILKNGTLPLQKIINDDGEETYLIAISDPFNLRIIGALKGIFGSNVRFVVGSKAKISKIQSLVYNQTDVNEAIVEYADSTISGNDEPVNADVVNSPAVKLTESILKGGIASDASDIHIEPYEDRLRVRYRIDGVLYESQSLSMQVYPTVITRFKIISGLNIAERRIPQDGRIRKNYNGVIFDFRVSTLPTVYGEKIVIRILDTSSFSFTRKQLGFTDEDNVKIDSLLSKPYGIILLTGPTGSGKSTTLYSFIKEISKEGVNVVTVEDPVEYTLKGVNQVQVNNKANLTFGTALRSILRQDPNIVMIGEIRDEETAQIANRMAITGHLVLSTLHTNDAPGAITRLIDLGLEPYFVSDALCGVIAQRLVRRLCPECKTKHLTTEAENKLLGIKESTYIYQPCGCDACHHTGYRGRIGVFEILTLDNELKEMISSKCSTEDIREKAINKGMIDLEHSCIKAVLAGTTSIQELSSIIYKNED